MPELRCGEGDHGDVRVVAVRDVEVVEVPSRGAENQDPFVCHDAWAIHRGFFSI